MKAAKTEEKVVRGRPVKDLRQLRKFSRQLSLLMKAQKISAAELARQVGVTPMAARSWRTGVCLPTFFRLRAIAKVLKVKVEELL